MHIRVPRGSRLLCCSAASLCVIWEAKGEVTVCTIVAVCSSSILLGWIHHPPSTGQSLIDSSPHNVSAYHGLALDLHTHTHTHTHTQRKYGNFPYFRGKGKKMSTFGHTANKECACVCRWVTFQIVSSGVVLSLMYAGRGHTRSYYQKLPPTLILHSLVTNECFSIHMTCVTLQPKLSTESYGSVLCSWCVCALFCCHLIGKPNSPSAQGEICPPRPVQ